MKIRNYFAVIGIGIFIYLLVKLNIISIINEILRADIFFIFLAFLIAGVLFFFQTLKWFFIARKQKIEINFSSAFRINLISNFYGFVTPSKMGTIIRADYLKEYAGNIGKGICNFTLDKILDTCSLFFMAIVFSFIFGKRFAFIPLVYLLVLFLFFMFLTFIFIKKERAEFFLRFFYRKFLPEKMKKKAKMSFESFYEDMPKKRWLLAAFLINIITWIVTYYVAFIIGISLGINLSFVYFLSIIPVGTIVALIPITINGLGTREATLIGLFGLFGVSPEKVFSMSVINIFITMIIPSIIASFLILKKRD